MILLPRVIAERDAVEAAINAEMKLATAANANDEGDESLGDLAVDVHLHGFDLANKKGAGDLLSGAALTLSAGRRYGLLGRNGCGKTTLLEYLSTRPKEQRSKNGKPYIPDRMSLLLVKQEIVGSDLTATETVVKSDARREGLKAAIKQLEAVARPTPSAVDALNKCHEKLARRDELAGTLKEEARFELLPHGRQ
jgi:ATP-binding cassette subfamily F protein 3